MRRRSRRSRTTGSRKFNKEKGANWEDPSEVLPCKIVVKEVHGQRVPVKVYPSLHEHYAKMEKTR